MTIRKYSDLLPSYLDGPNIQAHAELLETQDKKIDDKINLLSLWNVLERPILIEKISTNHGYWGTMNIYINSPTPIKEINITGSDTETRQYEESEVKTKETISYNLNGKISIPDPFLLPSYHVEVITYDGQIFRKWWPENDEKQGNPADHDEMLDIIGNFLGIHRRHFIGCNTLEGLLPPYNVKSKTGPLAAAPCTEDDYYYYARLKQFVSEFGETNMLELMASVLYSTTGTIIDWDPDRWAPVISPLTIALSFDTYDYPNFPITNIVTLLEKFVPITRNLFAFLSHDYWIGIDDSRCRSETNYRHVEGTVGLKNYPVKNAHLKIQIYPYDRFYECTTDNNGHYELTVGGLNYTARDTYFAITPLDTPDYAVPGNAYSYPCATPNTLFMQLVAWPFKKYTHTYMDSLIDATNDAQTNVVTGAGVLVWTPVFDFSTVLEVTHYGDVISMDRRFIISFHYTDRFQRVGFAKVTENDGTASYNDGILLNVVDYLGSSDLSTTHTLTARILNGKMYLYLDGNYTGKNYDYSNVTEGMLCFVALNNRKDSGQELVIGSGSTADVDISTPPAQVTLPESLDTDYPSNWSFNLRGTNSTDPVFNNDGTITMGKYTYHIPEYKLDINKVYTVYFYKNNVSVTDLGIGICDAERPPVSSNAPASSAARGVVTGNNKVEIFYEGNSWKKRYNDSTIISLNTVDDGNKYLCITTTNNAGNLNKILYITEANFNSLAVADSTKWDTQIHSGTTRTPTTTTDGYDIGRNYDVAYNDFTVDQNTTNKTIEIEFNAESSSRFRAGLATSSYSWGTSYYNSNSDSEYTAGTHLLRFKAGETAGSWDIYFDERKYSTITINSSRRLTFWNVNAAIVKILGIRVYDNND